MGTPIEPPSWHGNYVSAGHRLLLGSGHGPAGAQDVFVSPRIRERHLLEAIRDSEHDDHAEVISLSVFSKQSVNSALPRFCCPELSHSRSDVRTRVPFRAQVVGCRSPDLDIPKMGIGI